MPNPIEIKLPSDDIDLPNFDLNQIREEANRRGLVKEKTYIGSPDAVSKISARNALDNGGDFKKLPLLKKLQAISMIGTAIGDVASKPYPGPYTPSVIQRSGESLASGATAGLSDHLLAALRRNTYAPGSNIPYNETLNEIRRRQTNPALNIAGAFLPGNLPTSIGRGLGSLANRAFGVGRYGTIGNIASSIPAGALGGALTGGGLSALQNITQLREKWPEVLVNALIGSGIGAIANPLAVGGTTLESKAFSASKELSEDVHNLDKLEKQEHITKMLRKQWDKLSGGKRELNDSEVQEVIKNSLESFSKESRKSFSKGVKNYLTGKFFVPKKTQQSLMSTMIKNNLIKKNPATGKYTFESIGEGFYPQPVKSNIAINEPDLPGLSQGEQKTLFKTYKGITATQSMSTKGMQGLKQTLQGQVDFDKPGAAVLKSAQAQLKLDILDGVEKQFGKAAKNTVAKAYENASNNIELQKFIESSLPKISGSKSASPEQFYKAFTKQFAENTKFRHALMKVVNKKDLQSVSDDVLTRSLLKGFLGEQNNFRPKTFMTMLKNMQFGRPNGTFEKLARDGLFPQESIRSLKRLYNFSEQVLKKGITDIPLSGPVIDEGMLNVSTSLGKLLGPNANQLLSRSGIINRAKQSAINKLATETNLEKLGKSMKSLGMAGKGGTTSYIINKLLNSLPQ